MTHFFKRNREELNIRMKRRRTEDRAGSRQQRLFSRTVLQTCLMALLYVPCTAGRAPAIPALKGRSLRLRLRAQPGRSGRGTFRCALCKLQLLRRHSDAPRRWESTTGSALHPRAPHTQHPAMSSCARVALVTGANKGIGFAIVRDLCRQFPGDVVLTARNTARGQAAVQQLQAEGLSPRFHQLDIDDLQSIRALRDFLLKEYGGLDVLVNNAGIAFKTIDSTPFHIQAEVTMKTNFFGTQDVCTELLPLIKPR
ncbi:hypothetical protein EI555_005952, partial [Monodon monoceros]